jgi:hypothetical protein
MHLPAYGFSLEEQHLGFLTSTTTVLHEKI